MTDTPQPRAARIASIDWMRGVVMILMVVDHASMAFDGQHLSTDSAGLYQAGEALPAVAFLSRWATHLCAPTFVFLAGTALALSIEKRALRGEDPRETDRQIVTRGAIIALLDPTLISLTSGRLTLQVLFAIGVSMMAMAPLRRLSSPWLVGVGLGWIVLGEVATAPLWDPAQGWPQPAIAAFVATYLSPTFKVNYPVLPWLSMMVLGWAFGRYLVGRLAAGDVEGPKRLLWSWGLAALTLFVVARGLNDYGNMFLLRLDDGWVQWLHVSKYPPSLSYTSLELGLLAIGLASLITLEARIGVRQNGVLLVYGQTSMFFYLAHRLTFEGSATWLGLRGQWGLVESYGISVAALIALYPACRWYRGFKRAHPDSLLKYF